MRRYHFPNDSEKGVGSKVRAAFESCPTLPAVRLWKVTSASQDSLPASVRSGQGPETWSMSSKWQTLILSCRARAGEIMAHTLISPKLHHFPNILSSVFALLFQMLLDG